MSNRKHLSFLIMMIGGLAPLVTFGGIVTLGGIPGQTIINSPASDCSVVFRHALYEGQNFRAYDALIPGTTASSREILDSSRMLIYNPYGVLGDALGANTLGGLLPTFTYKSNGRPGTTHFGSTSIGGVISYKQDNPTYAVLPSPNPSRTSIATQIVHELHRRQVSIWKTAGSYTLTYLDLYNNAGSESAFPPDTYYGEAQEHECQNFYVAKCGDGIQDNPNKLGGNSTDGRKGIVVGGQMLFRSITGNNLPAEECDGTDGVPAGYICNSSCQLVALQQPTCSLTPITQTIIAGQTAVLNFSSQNAISISNLNNIPVGTIAPNVIGSFHVSPVVNTSYGFTVHGAPGTTPVTCNATVYVTHPHTLQCTITATPNPVFIGQNVTIGWNVVGGNFYQTFINVTPSLIGSWPFIVNANQYNGSTAIQPTQVGNYIFTMTVNNLYDSATCTGVLHVINNIPPTCSLTTSTSNIISGQTAILSGSYTNGVIASITPTIAGLNFIYPNWSNPNISVNPTTTTTYTLIVTGAAGTTPAICPVTIYVNNPQPILTIQKTLINNIAYQSGDLIGWMISFANIGSGTAHNVILSDLLPTSLSYVSSHLYGVQPGFTWGTGMFGPNISVTYSGFDLAAGQTGYLIITGRLLGYGVCNDTENRGFIHSTENPEIYAHASFNCFTPDTNMTITKTVNASTFHTGDTVNFTVTLTNNGPYVPTTITLGDLRPNPACLVLNNTWSSTVPMTLTTNSNPYLWMLNNPLPVGQSATLYLNGQIANSPACVTSYTNVANLTYIFNGVTKTGQAMASFNVIAPTPYSNQCQSLTSYDGGVILAQLDDNTNRYNGHAAFKCEAASVASSIVIDCGNGEFRTGNNVSFLNATCHYSESSVPQNRTATCYVDTTTNSACQQKIIVDQGFGNYCGDGVIGEWEKCDLGTNDATIHNYLDEQGTVSAGHYANDGYYCHDCDIEKKGNNESPPMAACFSVNNNNISVQENELLPFRRNVEGANNLTTSCSNSNSQGKILKSSLMCQFRLFNGSHPESAGYDESYALTVNSHGDKTITLPCNTDMWTTNGSFGDPLPLFDYFYNQRFTNNIWSLQNPFGRYYITMNGDILNDGNPDSEKTYGEYNLALYQVTYNYCIDNNGHSKPGTPIDRVCEVDFAVTKPYLAQKSSFGLTPKSTTINLGGYKDIFGHDIVQSTDLNKITVLNANAYDGGSAVKTMMGSFINKYEKLAIYVKTINNGAIAVSKVPSQNIFVFKGNGEIVLKNSDRSDFTTPFTMIIDGANLVIKGSITNTNGMFLVKNGMIKFDEPTDAAQRCATNQTVQGIFVTDLGFGSDDNVTNTNINTPRCPNGGLDVKGVLIGDGIDNLVKTKRSHLNHRFISGSPTDSATMIERRNEIFNGAAVLIEYSPSLRSNLPPGASDFTKALDVYKK